MREEFLQTIPADSPWATLCPGHGYSRRYPNGFIVIVFGGSPGICAFHPFCCGGKLFKSFTKYNWSQGISRPPDMVRTGGGQGTPKSLWKAIDQRTGETTKEGNPEGPRRPHPPANPRCCLPYPPRHPAKLQDRCFFAPVLYSQHSCSMKDNGPKNKNRESSCERGKHQTGRVKLSW